jgi:hypothetical protein
VEGLFFSVTETPKLLRQPLFYGMTYMLCPVLLLLFWSWGCTDHRADSQYMRSACLMIFWAQHFHTNQTSATFSEGIIQQYSMTSSARRQYL